MFCGSMLKDPFLFLPYLLSVGDSLLMLLIVLMIDVFLNMVALKEGANEADPMDEGGAILRTVYLLFVGDGMDTIFSAN